MICIFDCETVPDIELVKKSFNITKSENLDIANEAFELQLKKTGSSSFLPIPFHQVVSISAVIAGDDLEFKKVGIFNGKNEEAILKDFLNFIDKKSPKLVSFNGRGFDLPMLMVRAMKYNITCKGYFSKIDSGKTNFKNYRYRFDETYHLDLMDSISDFGAVRGLNLNTLASMMNIPGKFDVSGDEVHTLYFNDKLDEINQYCESDVLNTYWILLKYKLLQGEIDKIKYQKILNGFIENLPEDKNYSDIFKDFLIDELDRLEFM